MDKKRTTSTLSEEERQLFRTAVKKIQPIKSTSKVLLKKKPIAQKRPVQQFNEAPNYFLSDQQSEDTVSTDQKLFFVRSGVSPKQIRQLKQGKIPIVANLDLHGFDSESAREALISFIEFAFKQNKRCVSIIHGKGHTNTPILKNKINNWLRQFDEVLAFCTALPRHGGTGAIYVLIKSYDKHNFDEAK